MKLPVHIVLFCALSLPLLAKPKPTPTSIPPLSQKNPQPSPAPAQGIPAPSPAPLSPPSQQAQKNGLSPASLSPTNPEASPTPELTPVIRPQIVDAIPTLSVSDLARSAKFYASRLGFAVLLTTGSDYMAVGRDAVEIGLVTFKGRSPANRGSCYVKVSGIDALREEFKVRGVNVTSELQTKPSRMREFTVLDPDENTLIFGEYVGKAQP